MADKAHLRILQRGAEAWNSWRVGNPSIEPDLTGANLSRADLHRANLTGTYLTGANLTGANLTGAKLYRAKLRGAILSEADLHRANLGGAKLSGADLSGAILTGTYLSGADLGRAILGKVNLTEANLSRTNLSGAYLSGVDLSGAYLYRAKLSEAKLSRAILSNARLSGADLYRAKLSEAKLSNARLTGAYLSGAILTGAYLANAKLSGADLTEANLSRVDLSGADLRYCTLASTNLENATLEGCRIYGISAWDLNLTGAEQKNLVISPEGQPDITTDDLEVAQFIYLLLDNKKIRNVIETMTSKAVLILGNFSEERKAVLEKIREKLRDGGYLPILFDFEGPTSQDTTETVSTLARLARFIVADVTEARSVSLELEAFVPDVEVPVWLLLDVSSPDSSEPSMVRNYRKYPWFLGIRRYAGIEALKTSFLETEIIRPADKRFKELELERVSALAGEA